MADEAYRAVFLRVHPTGKMVLSLTTEADGKEADYAQLVADELGVPALDVKVVPADTTASAPATASTPAPRPERRRRSRARPARSAPRPSCWPGWRSRRRADASVGQRRVRRARPIPAQAQTIADLALYAHGSGALPPGVEGGLDAQTVYRD